MSLYRVHRTVRFCCLLFIEAIGRAGYLVILIVQFAVYTSLYRVHRYNSRCMYNATGPVARWLRWRLGTHGRPFCLQTERSATAAEVTRATAGERGRGRERGQRAGEGESERVREWMIGGREGERAALTRAPRSDTAGTDLAQMSCSAAQSDVRGGPHGRRTLSHGRKWGIADTDHAQESRTRAAENGTCR